MPNLDLKGYSRSVPSNIATKLLPFALYSILITLAVAMRLIFFLLSVQVDFAFLLRGAFKSQPQGSWPVEEKEQQDEDGLNASEVCPS